MKAILLMLGILALFETSALAESRGVVIVVHQIKEVGPVNTKVTGYTYSLLSDLKEERLKEATLEALVKAIPKIRNSGSMVSVGIQADDRIQPYALSQIMLAMCENYALELIYLEAGLDARVWGPQLFDFYGVKTKKWTPPLKEPEQVEQE